MSKITIESKPFSKTLYYSGEYKVQEGSVEYKTYLFTLIEFDSGIEVHFIEGKPKNPTKIKKQIKEMFLNR